MSNASQQQAQTQQTQAQQTQTAADPRLPSEGLTIQQTLRIMDVARELRDRRESAEEMIRRDDLRSQLRETLMRTARMSGDDVSEEEIDVAIGQYVDSLHTYRDPAPGIKRFLAHCWVWRNRILFSAAALAGLWLLFG
jgi:hypothetical protein